MTSLQKFTDERGISAETLEAFGVVQDGDRVRLPYPGATKYRKGWEPGERQFFWEGKATGFFNSHEGDRSTVFLVEGESDCMRLWQDVPDHTKVGVVGMPGLDGFKPEHAADITAERVFVVLDNDTDYAVVGQSERAWTRIRDALGARAKRVRLSAPHKDLCEFLEGHDLEALGILVQKSLVSRFQTLDLRGDPPPTRWLVQGLIARGDVHLLFGDPGVGKSWLTLELATAVAEGRSSWLSHQLLDGVGRVLYVDEENPADVDLQRLRLLGLSDRGADNLRFLSHQGIRLDSRPGELLEEAENFKPDLIVLDSLTRIHGGEENSSGDISKLFNDGIQPLARKVGAAVVVIHHTNKSKDGSSFQRSRGSGDIIGAPDTAFDMRHANPDAHTVSLIIAKSRRVEGGHKGTFERVITPTSAKHVEAYTYNQEGAPF